MIIQAKKANFLFNGHCYQKDCNNLHPANFQLIYSCKISAWIGSLFENNLWGCLKAVSCQNIFLDFWGTIAGALKVWVIAGVSVLIAVILHKINLNCIDCHLGPVEGSFLFYCYWYYNNNDDGGDEFCFTCTCNP